MFFIKLTLTLTVTVTRVFVYALTAEPTVPAGEYRLVMQRELEALGGPVIKLHSLRNVPHAEGRAQKGVSIKMWLADSSGDYVQIYTPIFPICHTPFSPYLRIQFCFSGRTERELAATAAAGPRFSHMPHPVFATSQDFIPPEKKRNQSFNQPRTTHTPTLQPP